MSDESEIEKIKKLAKKQKTEKILKYIEKGDHTIVCAAIDALGTIHDESAVNALANLISNDDPKIRIEAAKSIVKTNAGFAKTHLQHQLEVEKDPAVKEALKQVLYTK